MPGFTHPRLARLKAAAAADAWPELGCRLGLQRVAGHDRGRGIRYNPRIRQAARADEIARPQRRAGNSGGRASENWQAWWVGAQKRRRASRSAAGRARAGGGRQVRNRAMRNVRSRGCCPSARPPARPSAMLASHATPPSQAHSLVIHKLTAVCAGRRGEGRAAGAGAGEAGAPTALQPPARLHARVPGPSPSPSPGPRPRQSAACVQEAARTRAPPPSAHGAPPPFRTPASEAPASTAHPSSAAAGWRRSPRRSGTRPSPPWPRG